MTETSEYVAAVRAPAEERARLLAQHPREVVWVVNGAREVVFVSAAVELSLGYTPREFARLRTRDIVHPDDRDHLDDATAGVQALPGSESRFEMRVRHADGNWRLVEALAVNLLADPDVAGVIFVYRDITERRAAEDLLRAREARFRTLVQSSRDVILMADAEYRIAYVSPSSKDVFGWDPEDVMADVLGTVHPEDVQSALAFSTKVRAAPGHHFLAEGAYRHRDGSVRWMEVTSVNLLDDPEVAAVVTTLHDITARKGAEGALRESEARFRALVEHSSDMVGVLDGEGRYRYASDSASRILGFSPSEIIGRTTYDFLPPERHAGMARLWETILATEAPVTMSGWLQHADGSWRWVETTATNQLDNEGVRGIVINARDLTDRRRAEEALKASEERFRALVQQSSDVVAVLDTEGRIVWMSPASERQLGWPADDLVGTSGFDLIHPDDLERAIAHFSIVLDDGIDPDEVVMRVRTADGGYRFVDVSGVNLIDNPAVGGIAINLRDVTDRVLAVEASAAAARDRGRLTDIIEATSDLVAITGKGGQTLYMNSSCRAFFGLGPDDPLDRFDFEPYAPPWVRARYRDETLPTLRTAGIWAGELAYYRDGGEVPVSALFLVHRDNNGELEFVSSVTRDISERKAFEARLEHEATHDPLTGLPNRTLLLDRLDVALARATRTGKQVAVLFCDLDQFKVVNDSLGHSRGDQLLVTLAGRLRTALRPGDTVARFGGDEFVVLCDDLNVEDDASAIADRIQAALREPVRLGDGTPGSTDRTEVYVSASIGIACSNPSVESAPEALVRDADAAMYRAKERGRARHEIFDEHLRAVAVERLDIETALRRAIARRELHLVYQPSINLTTGKMVGVEALLRWAHPERGLLLPEHFISVAEETGLIVPMGAWVLRQACTQLVRWQASLPDRDPLFVCINLSGRQLDHPDLADEMAGVLAATGADPSLVDLEITESVVMRDPAATERTLDELKALGVKVAIDDFGTGYSSLAYLRRFPVDHLKVDRAFVDGLGRDAEDSAIVAAVVSLAHTLGLEAIAEGVETAEQLAELRVLGCDMAQGFHIARPLDPEAVLDLLRTDPTW